MSGHWIDLKTWPRRTHYAHFMTYEVPFFNLCTEVDAGPTWRWCKANHAPFALACWYAAQQATDAVEAMRMRLRPEGIWVHDAIYIASTVALPGDIFGFCHFPRATSFTTYQASARAAIAALADDEPVDDRPEEDGLIHGSVVPWVRFTGLSHPHRLGHLDSVPKLVFGKAVPQGDRVPLPISVAVHHALVDGVHVAKFLEALQGALNSPGH